jgi:hypothetical protein
MRTITKAFTLGFSFFAISASIMMMFATIVTTKALENAILWLYVGIIITGIGSMACNLWESWRYEEE